MDVEHVWTWLLTCRGYEYGHDALVCKDGTVSVHEVCVMVYIEVRGALV